MENKELFNKYDEGHHWENHPTIYAEEFLEFLKKNMHPCVLANDVMIVDLGCGTGRDVNHFHQAGVSAMGVDSNEEAISVAQRNYPESRFCYCDIHQLPYMDKRPLAYFCINVMHYVDAPKVMEEIYKTLIPGEYAFLHFNLLIVDQEQIQDYHQEIAEVYTLVKKFQIVDKKIFSREDSKPMPHIHNILQIIIKKIGGEIDNAYSGSCISWSVFFKYLLRCCNFPTTGFIRWILIFYIVSLKTKKSIKIKKMKYMKYMKNKKIIMISILMIMLLMACTTNKNTKEHLITRKKINLTNGSMCNLQISSTSDYYEIKIIPDCVRASANNIVSYCLTMSSGDTCGISDCIRVKYPKDQKVFKAKLCLFDKTIKIAEVQFSPGEKNEDIFVYGLVSYIQDPTSDNKSSSVKLKLGNKTDDRLVNKDEETKMQIYSGAGTFGFLTIISLLHFFFGKKADKEGIVCLGLLLMTLGFFFLGLYSQYIFT